jgi:putative nucleotidyltransferase with HDIG domain
MKIPNRQQAQGYLNEAEGLNPGSWIQHSVEVAKAAESIASYHPQIESEPAYVLGLLHDIGRRAGVHGMRHVVDGYNFMMEAGYPDVARICITHSYPIQHINSGSSRWDGTKEEHQFVADFLSKIKYTPYDRLIQLCDAICLPTGPVLMEKRIVDVVMRYGFNDFTIKKWKSFFKIRDEFERIIGQSIYGSLPNVVKNTFGIEHG